MSAPAFAPPAGRRPSIEWVPVDELHIDVAYQRSIETRASQRHIEKIAAAWNWDLCMVLAVSRRPDDRHFVVDGQHRLAAARLRGDIDMMPCCVTRRTGADEEAMLFIAANRTRRGVNALDDFHAAVAAGDPESASIARIVGQAGLSLARHKASKHYSPGEIANIGGLRSALKAHGETALADALSTMAFAFRGEVFTAPATFVGALVSIYASPPPLFSRDRFEMILAARTTEQWASAANLELISGGMTRILALKRGLLAAFAETWGGASSADPVPPRPTVARGLSFEDQLEAVRTGKAGLTEKLVMRRPDHDMTLGGVGSAML